MHFLVSEKCKPCEIYRTMFDVYGKTSFRLQNIYTGAKRRFTTTSQSRKDSPGNDNILTLSVKFQGIVVSNEGHADNFLGL